ncbi:hypothetical protein A2291_03190 [candidate division WOR-1 bacterium RIFOXYB2_FULL_42_35]|uniref:Flagellar biosynthetic protein FliR n=1 Tax=candidate division WOR-1 bacterium RIFOXYC2_FULL_41_25 TaxID=1802586 RepID=A0A1F4TII5_UNCSA|nr:MAG: hypothetical protein A2247_02265 [candidate division WOR-1 bacterium RIFOXYA2_FULL_41_14]OGC21563.1 MAG: hypothetical protein A2291_03190 [candidate division WOR-1 bacterium RIFOXYB2_FULL_42_35]OGC32541.1 MAG: hypothetical protein A2462_02900 [candidate division WOR-1 bacterium RIFOXYC2_FULL_41_25]
MIISTPQLTVFFLILARIAGIFIQAPILNSKSIPFMIKSALAIWISLVLWFVVPVYQSLPATLPLFLGTLIFEVAFGFAIGFLCNIIFIGIQAGGEIIDMQMGLSVATALDPTFGAVISIVGRLCFWLAIFIFIGADGLHLLFSSLNQTFSVIPAGKIANFTSPHLVELFISLGTNMWETAIRLAAPAIILIFLSDFTFGIVSRVAPQVNVFMLGFQVKPLLGMFGIMLALPFILNHITKLMEFMTVQAALLINILK